MIIQNITVNWEISSYYYIRMAFLFGFLYLGFAKEVNKQEGKLGW